MAQGWIVDRSDHGRLHRRRFGYPVRLCGIRGSRIGRWNSDLTFCSRNEGESPGRTVFLSDLYEVTTRSADRLSAGDLNVRFWHLAYILIPERGPVVDV